MARILLVEDDEKMSTMIVDRLKFERYDVELATDGNTGLEMVKASDFDLIILDWNLPGASGIDICRRYRVEGGQAPVLILTGNQAIHEKEQGLEAGADDYLTKPFNPRELLARVKALMRRTGKYQGEVTSAKSIQLDRRAHSVVCDGKSVDLSGKEFDVLELFLRNPNTVFSYETLLQRVWGLDTEAGVSAVHSCIKRLRKKLGSEDVIVSVYGSGYKLEA